MTTNTERTRNLIQTGSFLRLLREDMRLPQHMRNEADRLARHYPAVLTVNLGDEGQAFRIEEPWFGTNLDPKWWQI